MLFAGTDGMAPGLVLNTWTGTEARTVPIVLPAIQALVNVVAEQIRAERPAFMNQVDPFGKSMKWAAINGYQLRVTSSGPDEKEGTADDVVAMFEFYEAAPPQAAAGGDNAEFEAPAPEPGGDRGDDGDGAAAGGNGGGAEPPRVRRNFPETPFVELSLITDGNGDATLTVPLADSITTWRITALANTTDGLLGSTDHGVRVFQDFFVDLDVPAAVTRGDEIGLTLALYNDLDTPQTVHLDVQAGDWYALTGAHQMAVDLGANEVRGVRLPLRVERVGTHELTVVARGTSLSDAVARQVRVEPDGQKVEQLASGRLTGPAHYSTRIPQGSVADSGKLLVRLYPGLLSQVMTGLDEPIVFTYHLQATEPVRAQAPRSRIYSYYNPGVGADSAPVEFEVQ